MSRKDWSEARRQEEVQKIDEKIRVLDRKLEHLLSEEWREPYD